MPHIHHRLLSLSAAALLIGNNMFAQTVTKPTFAEQQVITRLSEQDPASFIPTVKEYDVPWMPIKMRDILWKKRIWREIDTRDAANKGIDSRLAGMLLAGCSSGAIKAYSMDDGGHFNKVMANEELAAIDPATVLKYQIKEDWLYVTGNKMVVRILGIAPMIAVKGEDGKVTDRPLFWVYYPDCRNYLAAAKIPGTSTTWDQLFQSRKFASTITQVSSANGPVSYKTQ